jgi:hypothetical protein
MMNGRVWRRQCTGWFHGDKQAQFAYHGVTTLLVVGTWFPFPGSSGGEFNGAYHDRFPARSLDEGLG